MATCSLAGDGGEDAGLLGDLVRQCLQASLYVRGRAGESEGRGVEADLVRADGYGCGRGVAVALAVDEHAGGYVEDPGVGEDLVVVAVSSRTRRR